MIIFQKIFMKIFQKIHIKIFRQIHMDIFQNKYLTSTSFPSDSCTSEEN